MNVSRSVFFKSASLIALSITCFAQTDKSGMIQEFALQYPPTASCTPNSKSHSNMGSTHELTYNNKDKTAPRHIWLTGQKDNAILRVGMDGKPTFYDMTSFGLDPCSGPHGIEFDDAGRLWVSLEFAGKIVQFSADRNGNLIKGKEYDVQLNCDTCPRKINTHPHGMAFASDGKTLWYTGKATGTIGRITPVGKVENFDLPTAGSVPIYIKAGPDGNMWFTELAGNIIGRITPVGNVKEFPIPTHNSRPIEIVAEPGGGQALWFTEEAGNKVGRIGMDGTITEFPVPKMQDNVILAGLAFDNAGNLWVQQYIDVNNPNAENGKFTGPVGSDYIIRIDKSILAARPSDISKVAFTFYKVPTRQTVMHRIIQGPDGNIWFTEMMPDKVGRLILGN
jgi:virginiamycin B lyase